MFKVGDEVVCIDPNSTLVDGTAPCVGLVNGHQYTVSGVGVWPGNGVYPVVFLAETGNIGRGGVDFGYCPSRFRKVQRRDSSLSIESFLTIKPGYEEPRRKAPAKKERV